MTGLTFLSKTNRISLSTRMFSTTKVRRLLHQDPGDEQEYETARLDCNDDYLLYVVKSRWVNWRKL